MAELDKASESNLKSELKVSEWLVPLIVLIFACLQFSVGGQLTETGEVKGLSIPLATLVLGIVFVYTVISQGKSALKHFPFPIAIVSALICLGLLGLSKPDLKQGIKELIQIIEIFFLAAFIALAVKDKAKDQLFKYIGYLSAFLICLSVAKLYQKAPFLLSEARYTALVAISYPFLVYSLRAHKTLVYPAIILPSLLISGTSSNGGLLIAFLCSCLLSLVLLPKVARIVMVITLLSALAISFMQPNQPWSSLDHQYNKDYQKRIYIEQSAALSSPKFYPLGAGPGNYKEAINHLKLYMDELPSPEENTIAKDTNNQYLVLLVESGLVAMIAFIILLMFAIHHSFKRIEDEDEPVGNQRKVIFIAIIALLIASYFCTSFGKGIGIWTGMILAFAFSFHSQESSVKDFFIPLIIPTSIILFVCGLMVLVNKEVVKNNYHVSKFNHKLRLAFFKPEQSDVKEKRNGLEIIEFGADGQSINTTTFRLEAEAAEQIVEPFVIKSVSDQKVSGSTLDIPLKSGKGKGSAIYNLEIKSSGLYKINARVYWLDGCSNSLSFHINGKPYVITDEQFKTWHTVSSLKKLKLDKGTYRIELKNLEDGIRLDWFELEKIN